MEGWIKIHRKIMDNPLYLSEPFTRMQAWIDLLLLANHKEGFFYVRGNKVVVGRGQVGTSSRTLASRWQWSRGKVERFLKDLENDNQIEPQKNNVITLISICNYDDYQNTEPQTEPQTSHRQTTDEPQTDRNKNDKKEKNEKNNKADAWILKVDDKFKDTVSMYLDYRKGRKESYKTEKSFMLMVNKLIQMSGNNPIIAKQIVEQSMINNWAGLFELKQNNNKSYEQTATRTRKKLY